MKKLEANVYLSGKRLRRMPQNRDGTYLFDSVYVYGVFNVSDNELTSLTGSPKRISRYFYCEWNQLESLRGAPVQIEGDFDCSYNNLKSLDGCPRYVGGAFMIAGNAVKFSEAELRKVCRVRGGIITERVD